jgi:hypothetical protein
MLHLEEHPVMIGGVVLQSPHRISAYEHARELVNSVLGKLFALLFVTAFTGLEVLFIVGLVIVALSGLNVLNLYDLTGWSVTQVEMPLEHDAFAR